MTLLFACMHSATTASSAWISHHFELQKENSKNEERKSRYKKIKNGKERDEKYLSRAKDHSREMKLLVRLDDDCSSVVEV